MRWQSILCAAVAMLPLDVGLVAQTSQVNTEIGVINITPLVHSSVQIEYNGLVIQVDPWGVIDLSAALSADIILISDDVGHHLDKSAIEKLSKPETQIIMPRSGESHISDGKVLNNGEVFMTKGVTIQSVAAYDIIPGEPSHLKGDANGYLVKLGGKHILLAGVTECVEEVLALENVDVAFIPMNIPLGRMTPEAAAECTRQLNPDIVFLYHYNQRYAARASRSGMEEVDLSEEQRIRQSLELFEQELKGSGIEVRMAEWYPSLN